MRIFGSESINNVLKKLGLRDGESIDHPWINKALERAQQKVEARNFDIRKTLLKFDNVLNDQRQVIFNQRNRIIDSLDSFKYADEFLNEIIHQLKENKEKLLKNPKNPEFMLQLKSILGKSVEENELMNLTNLDNQNLSHKIKNNFEEKRNERLKYLGKNKSEEFEKNIFLQLIDQNWKFHIQYLEQLRGVIGLRSYGQRDPLVEYKKEAFSLFENLLKKLKTDLITILFNIRIIEEKSENKYNEEQKVDRKYVGKKMKRNEPCYCGSGKKFKHCCGAL